MSIALLSPDDCGDRVVDVHRGSAVLPPHKGPRVDLVATPVRPVVRHKYRSLKGECQSHN